MKSQELDLELPDVTPEGEKDSGGAQIQVLRKQLNRRAKACIRGKKQRSSLNMGLYKNSIILKSGAANLAQPQYINTAHKVIEQKNG